MSPTPTPAPVFAIPGGVHPPENKRQSMQRPLADAGIPAQLIFPLSQHLGTPAAACVEVGDQVLAGQVIAKMGSTSTDAVKLHFEIRRNGVPVNPATLLPRR